nr:retrovirus-related Pol polyprotein from transposon TNT 1-94 [Tanacetum cinerariifolium]
MDVKTSFLHGSLKEDVCVCQPEGFIDADHLSHVYKLKKALYGLKQAPREWYNKLSMFLLHNHFFKGAIDPTLFIRRFDEGILVAKPIEKHLKEVKRIFHYLQGAVNMEYVSLSACCAQVLWMRTQLTDYSFHYNKIPIYCDSKSAIAISYNPVQHSRTKHIVIHYHFIKEHVEKGTIELYFVKTDYQLADIFTKALSVDRFNYLVRRLSMRSLSPQDLDRLAKSHQSHRDLPRNTPLDRVEVLGSSNKVSVSIEGVEELKRIGDTEGYGSVNCNGITFTRVAYVYGLKHNLISISQLCDANFKVLFTKTQGTIFNQNDEVVLIAPRRRDFCAIDMSSFNKESNACFLAKATPRVNWLWHKRLSHLNFKNINNLAKHNLVFGLPSLTFSKDKNYLACEKGKHHKASFKTKRPFSINKSLHLLHMDLLDLSNLKPSATTNIPLLL